MRWVWAVVVVVFVWAVRGFGDEQGDWLAEAHRYGDIWGFEWEIVDEDTLLQFYNRGWSPQQAIDFIRAWSQAGRQNDDGR